MGIELIHPNATQMQGLVDKPVGYPAQNDTLSMLIAPISGTVTVQSIAAVALKASASDLAGRSRLTVRNPSFDKAVRIGGAGVTTKRGFLLEPQGTVTIEQDKDVAVAVYAIATGYEVSLEVLEA